MKSVEMIGPEKTLLLSPSPVDETRPQNRTNEIMRKYADIVEQIAKSTGSKYVDLFCIMIERPDYLSMLSDGLHFNSTGYSFLAELILRKIGETNW